MKEVRLSPWRWRGGRERELKGETLLLQVTTNLLYHCSVESLGWLSSKAEEEWRIQKSDHGWWQILQRSWHSKLPLVAKVFVKNRGR